MKRIITALTIMLVVATTIQAQDTRPMREKRKLSGDMMQNLKLSDEQRQKMKSLREDFRNQFMDLRKNDNITMKEYRTRIETLRKSQKERMQGLLTTEQKSRMEKARQDRNSMRKINEKVRGERMKVRLGLNNDQSNRMIEMHKTMAEKIKNLRENEALKREDRMEQLKALREKQRDEMKSILSPDQLKKMEEMKGRRHRSRS